VKRVGLLATIVLCGACSSDLPSIQSFTASRADVARGDAITFSWRVSGAEALELNPRPGTVTGTSVTVNAGIGGDYTLVASNSHGSVSASIPIHLVDIAQFAASPAEVLSDQPVTLSWKISGALSAALDGAEVNAVQGTHQVNPIGDTTYHLSARSGGATATATAVVRIGTPPVISSFTATPNPVPRGTATVLSWQAPGAQRFSLSGGDGAGPAGGLHSRRVRPLADTTSYTLTASNAFGSTTQDLLVTLTGARGTSLVYSPPAVGAGEVIRLVQVLAPPSPGTHVDLQLVATRDIALDGIALDLPFDGSVPGSRDGIARASVSLPGIRFDGLDFTTGSATPAAVGALPGSGPLAGVLILGMAQKPAAAGGPAGDAMIPAGAPLATFGLDLQAAGGTGLVFDGTTGDGFRLRLRTRAGDVQGTVAVGRLEVQ
jgi:hypothetical protein